MSGNMQVRANTGAMDQAAGDLNSHVGNLDTLREQARAEFNKVIGNLGDGIGTTQVAAVRAKFEEYLEDHVNSIKQSQTGLTKATDTMTQGANRMVQHLSGHGNA